MGFNRSLHVRRESRGGLLCLGKHGERGCKAEMTYSLALM